jgi:hypothetical protein
MRSAHRLAAIAPMSYRKARNASLGMGWARLAAVAAVGAVVASAAPASAAPFDPQPDPPRLVPIDGAHWQRGAGLPDARGAQSQGLVRHVATCRGLLDALFDSSCRLLDLGVPAARRHVEAGAVLGYRGRPTTDLGTMHGFAVRELPAGIIPCIRIAYTTTAGERGETMVTTDRMRAEPIPDRPDWTAYSFSGALPEGTIDEIEIGAHVEGSPPDPVRLTFDNIRIGTQLWTRAGPHV